MKVTFATCTIENFNGGTRYSQSRFHESKKFKGELEGDYDKRTAHEHLHWNDEGQIIIPSHALCQTLISAAKYSKKQIPGQGKATWTAKFTSGIALLSDPKLVTMGSEEPITVKTMAKDGKVQLHENIIFDDVFCNSDGIRGSGKRVMRRYPAIMDWKSTFVITVLDPIITKEIFMEIMGIAGMFIGLGRFRPEKGGSNGRFKMSNLDWVEDREFV